MVLRQKQLIQLKKQKIGISNIELNMKLTKTNEMQKILNKIVGHNFIEYNTINNE